MFRMSFDTTKKVSKKNKKCKVNNFIINHEKKNEYFRQLSEKTLGDKIMKLRQMCWGRNRRRERHFKASNILLKDLMSIEGDSPLMNQFRKRSVEMLWLELVRYVSLMIGVYGAMQKRGCILERITFRNIMDLYRVAVNTTELGVDNGMKVNYNYKDYVATKKVTVSADAKKVMHKQSNLRTHQEIMTLYSMMMNLPVFQNNYSHKLRWALAKNLKHYQCEAKRVLTAENRNPIRVYFIYSGMVNVIVDSEDTKSEKRTITLTRGSCIGHTKKTLQCVCATDCEFLSIDKSVYIKEGIHAVESRKLEQRFNFFRHWPPLENWSDNAIYDIANISYTDSYPSGTMILQDKKDEELDILWFVLSGKIDVVKVMSQKAYENRKNQSDILIEKTERSEMLKNSITKKITNSIREKSKCTLKSLRVPSNYKMKTTVSDTKDLKKCTVSDCYGVKQPIYLRMRTLTQGECYGLDNIEDDKIMFRLSDEPRSTNRFCLVSRDCVIIRLSCYHFKSLIQILGVNREKVSMAMHFYYDDSKIFSTMKQEIEWKNYKHYCVESQVLRRPSLMKDKNFNNHFKHTIPNLGITAFNQVNFMFPLKSVCPGGVRVINPRYTIVNNPLLKDPKNRCLD